MTISASLWQPRAQSHLEACQFFLKYQYMFHFLPDLTSIPLDLVNVLPVDFRRRPLMRFSASLSVPLPAGCGRRPGLPLLGLWEALRRLLRAPFLLRRLLPGVSFLKVNSSHDHPPLSHHKDIFFKIHFLWLIGRVVFLKITMCSWGFFKSF